MTENVTEDKPICIIEVNENLRRIKLGDELTRPLKELKTNCEFERKYNEWCNIQEGFEIDTDIKKIKRKEYEQLPEVIARKKVYMKKYKKIPEVKTKAKAYGKAYRESPEGKARIKAWRESPEGKAKIKVYNQTRKKVNLKEKK